ncbi:uncharacterized protein LOC129572060 [Sitodiplosis mosellana]|uniref:uncharacterized protein LOC129572060 n=1 Tax=Sitodiplosis mosellana TaxID=263140 RepID=UPI0024441999|nr:uncharacterized protein LOC129572060 [Sitodiplosis mosellana]
MSKRPLGASKIRYPKIERTLRRRKNEPHPKRPKEISDIINAYKKQVNMIEYGLNLRKTKRLYINTVEHEQFSFTLFASLETVSLIENHIPPEKRNYSVDGTFDVTPMSCFHQLLTIHIEYDTIVYPVFFVLMTRATAIAYKAVFRYIEDNIFELKPARFMADFEAAMRKAIADFYPHTEINGCWYHFCAAVRRKTLSFGLHNLIKNSFGAWSVYKKLLCLPLLPASKIVKGFNIVVQQSTDFGVLDEFEELFAYFQNFWLHLNSKNSISVCDLDNRTTSPLESYHSAMNRLMLKHASFFVFVSYLKLYESRRSDDLYNAIHDKCPVQKAKHRRDQERDKQIRSDTQLLCSGLISTEEFLNKFVGDERTEYHVPYEKEVNCSDQSSESDDMDTFEEVDENSGEEMDTDTDD